MNPEAGLKLDIRVLNDHASSPALSEIFDAYWPAYRRWMRRSPQTDAAHWRSQLRTHMPELVGVHDALCARLGDTEAVARFLSMYNPPRVVRACTQLVVDAHDGPRLLRTYDHHPQFFDSLILKGQWAATETLGVTDCLWGVLDGINEHGLAIALAFGGRNVVGPGFAAPLICRYVLETCATVSQARRALARLPVYMSYTFAVVDADGEFVTAFLGPDREATLVARRASANHQGSIEWDAYARFAQSAERLSCVESLVTPRHELADVRRAFLAPPIWRTQYAKASGTLYVAEYTPQTRELALHWPAHTERVSLKRTADREFTVPLPAEST